MGPRARHDRVTEDEWRLTVVFPGLRDARFEVTSPPDPMYNCIGWAVGSTAEWWEPNRPEDVWPEGAPRQHTIAAVMTALAAAGYERCRDGKLERDAEKAAIYGIGEQFTHVARQLPSGRWTSKLGVQWDIEHELKALASSANANGPVQYGEIVAYMARRPRAG